MKHAMLSTGRGTRHGNHEGAYSQRQGRGHRRSPAGDNRRKKETLCNMDALFMIRPGLRLRERLKYVQGLRAYRQVSPATW